jgi:energy-converting hydrogenase Eha subunit G
MKKISHHVPECFKPDDAEAARCCAAPLFLLVGLVLLGVVLAMFPGCNTIEQGARGFADDTAAVSDAAGRYFAED